MRISWKYSLRHSQNFILRLRIRFYCTGFSWNKGSGKLNGLPKLSSKISYDEYSDKVQIFYEIWRWASLTFPSYWFFVIDIGGCILPWWQQGIIFMFIVVLVYWNLLHSKQFSILTKLYTGIHVESWNEITTHSSKNLNEY